MARKWGLGLCALAVGLVLLVGPAGAGENLWNNGSGDGSYQTSQNWSRLHVPDEWEIARWADFGPGGTVAFNADALCGSAVINNGVMWNLDGWTYHLNGNLIVARNDSVQAWLTAAGGSLEAATVEIGGADVSQPGSLTFDGCAVLTDTIRIGQYAAGDLTISNGSLVETFNLEMWRANPGGPDLNSTATVTGGSLLTLQGVSLGRQGGVAALNVLDGARVQMQGFDMAWQKEERAALVIADPGSGVWSTGMWFALNHGSEAVVEVSNGGVLESSGIITVAAGTDSGSQAQVTVQGAGSRMTAANSILVGEGYHGTLNVLDGGEVEAGPRGSGSIWMAEVQTSRADVTVAGAGSRLAAPGEVVIGVQGEATLNVLDGGQVESGMPGESGVLMGDGTGSRADVTVRGAGSRITSASRMGIAWDGQATLYVLDGGEVTTGTESDWQPMCIANSWTSRAGVTVQGTGSRLAATGDMWIGREGIATLNVLGGAEVAAGTDANGGEIRMAEGWGSRAAVTVQGIGSRLTATGAMRIGQEGIATLNVLEGAEVAAGTGGGGEIHMAENSNSRAAVTVQGMGSRMTASGEIWVGQNGDATLNVLDGAEVTAGAGGNWGSLYMADSWGGRANVTVQGAGSRLTATGGMWIANQGDATLNVLDGAEVTAGTDGNEGEIYMADSGCANVTVQGVGSRMTASGEIWVGQNGGATLNVFGGGKVRAGLPGSPRDVYVGRAAIRIEGAGSEMTGGGIHIQGSSPDETATIEVRNGGLLEAADQMDVTAAEVLVNDGTIRAWDLDLNDGARLTLNDARATVRDYTYVESGALVILENTGRLVSGGEIFNDGTIRGDGVIGGYLENNGTVRAMASDYLELTGFDNSNFGRMELVGGTMDFAGDFVNELTGAVSGRGGLAFRNGMINHGAMNFGGDTDVYGRVVNGGEGALTGDGEVIVSGGASAAFYDPVVHNGAKFKISDNASAVFFGLVSGEAGFTGGGDIYFEGGYSPGNSPAWVQMGVNITYGSDSTNTAEIGGYVANGPGDTEYDVLEMIGGNTLVLDGTLDTVLLGGFEPVLGSDFDIFRYGNGDRAGEFDAFNSPIWGANRYFDITYGDTAVTLAVVPEPATLALLALGGVGLALKRRRD